jgi:DNA primase
MIQRLKKLTPLLITLLAVLAAPLGCAALSAAVPVLAQVATVATNAVSVLDAVEDASDAFFAVKPDAGKQAAVDRAINDCRLAIAAATSVAQGTKDLDAKQADAAFAQFREAYKNLAALLDDVGVTSGGKFGGPSGTALPEPLAAKPLAVQ